MRGSKRGFTLIELLVVIAIIAILAAILLPVFARVQAKAQSQTCLSNMKQLGNGIAMYAQDYDECFPFIAGVSRNAGTPPTWKEDIMPYIKSSNVFRCQRRMMASNWGSWTGNDYSMNEQSFPMSDSQTAGVDPSVTPVPPRALADINLPSELCLLGEPPASTGYWVDLVATQNLRKKPCAGADPAGWPMGFVHFTGCNIAYSDGHVKWVKKELVCSEAEQPVSRFWDYTAR